jgi:predicted TIM-barrel fold metal-dependent hydrolase
MRSLPWLKRKKTAPELPLEPPIRLGNMSNGEFFHQATPYERRVRNEILRQADDKARALGLDRREFLASAMGMATSLSVLNLAAACSDDDKGNGKMAGSSFADMGSAGRKAGAGASGSRSSGGAGGYDIPNAATMDCAQAEDILNGKGEFIFDIQTHHIEEEGDWRTTNPTSGPGLAQYFAQYNGCTSQDLMECIVAQAYLEDIFLNSDTTLAVLSGFPAALCTDGKTTNCGNSLDNDAMWRSRDRFNALARTQRVINHCQVNPTDNLDLQLAIMERIKKEHNCWGFKSYPEWGPDGKGWMLDDEKSGIPMIEKAIELDSKIICIHKGIVFPGWDPIAGHPKDVGVVAQRYPDVKFVVYHSAIEIDAAGEGAYDANNDKGTDRLCRTVDDGGLKGKNVYAELGSVWAQVMNAPEKAQHVIGKLLKHVGEDNVLWGSECVWFGSPQPQIEAFRAFQISQEMRDQYGYPELTTELKAKIFGLNSAKVYGIDPEELRCKITTTELAQLKHTMDGELGPRRWAFKEQGGPRTRREFWNLVRRTGGRPG